MLKCSFLIFRASQTGGRAYKVKSPESYLNQIPSITACSKRRVRKSLKTAVSQRLNAVSHWHTVTQWHGVPQCVLPRVSCQNFEYFLNKHLLISKIWIFGPYHHSFYLQNLTTDGPLSVHRLLLHIYRSMSVSRLTDCSQKFWISEFWNFKISRWFQVSK